MKSFFNPQTVAVVGATERENSVGRGLMENLITGDRKIFPVNLNSNNILGLESFPSISSIPEEIDLVVVAIPKDSVKSVIKECAEKNVGGVIIISAGFGETGPKGKIEEEEIKNILNEKNIPFMGPNCLGIIRPSSNLNASFAPGNPKSGDIAFISQSGALIDSVVDGSLEENYGFSFMVSPGNASGLSLVDYLNWAEDDSETKVIALYIEGLKNGREFYETAKKIKKPIVIIKGGKGEVSQRAVSSHTGSLAGETEIYSAVFKQAGIREVSSLNELFTVSKALSWQKTFKGGIAIVTNGGGVGVLTADYLQNESLPILEKETISLIEPYMHSGYSAGNPLDIVGDASAEKYKVAIEGVLKQENIKALVVIQTLQIMTEPEKNAKIIVEAQEKYGKTIVTNFMGKGEKTKKAIAILEKNKIPNYQFPTEASQALKSLSIKNNEKNNL